MSTNKPFLILGTVMLAAGAVAFMPPAIADWNGGPSGPRVMCKMITLDFDGTEKTVIFKARSDVILQEIWLDNSPTEPDCGPAAPDGTCVDSDFRISGLSIMGSVFRRNELPICVAQKDKIFIWGLMTQGFDRTYPAWPVAAGETLKLTLDAKPCESDDPLGLNDRRIKLCFGFSGKHDARILLED